MSDGPKPLHRQRSEWVHDDRKPMGGIMFDWHSRRVSDGLLIACVGEEPEGWHLSVSFRDHRGDYSRYPNWDELVHAARSLLPTDRAYHMILPPDGDYVALHDTTFHFHEWKGYTP